MTAPSSSCFLSPTLRRHPLFSPTTRPPPDDLANTWILEFILRQPVPDSLVNEIFLSLPFSSSDIHPHLRKALLLRRISSDLLRCSFSECTLHSLELIVGLDRHRCHTPSYRFKAAYCAVAVECTAKAFRRSFRDFVDAVESIWMAEAAEDLVSEPFLEWGKRMERCISSGGGEEILKRDVDDVARLVRDYLAEALEEMGPSFLEIVATEFLEKRMDLDAVADKTGKGVTEMNGCFEKLDENDEELENDGGGIPMGTNGVDEVRRRSGGMADTSVKHLGVNGVGVESDGLCKASTMQGGDFNGVLEASSHSVGVEVGIEDIERGVNVGGHAMTNHGRCNIRQVDPGEVSKVKDALKKSCFDLNRMVEDPLPEAQAVAAAVLDSISGSHVSLNTEKQIFLKDPALPVSSVELVTGISTGVEASIGDLEKEKGNSSDLMQMEGNHIVKACNNDAGPSKRRDVGASRSLFERNPTARTREWSDDSLESSVPMEEQQSPNPMSKRISPTRLDKGKLVKRRAVKRWSPQEEHTLREAVAKHGKGNWKLILKCYSDVFEERTEVDLKDKWRNMARYLC